MSNAESSSEVPSKAGRPLPQVDATLAHEYDVESTTESNGQYQKQEFDLAFTAEALERGTLTVRQISKALRNWTIYGSQPVADKLVAEGLVTAADRAAWSDEARRRLARVREFEGDFSSPSQIFRARSMELDKTGRVAKLLGLKNIEPDVTGQSREVHSRFSLVRKLGEGGLGTVWLARDESLRRYVAIKEIRAGAGQDNAAAIARFRREAELTGRLEHPGIVPVYEFGTDQESGRDFYVMRFLGKHTMQDAIVEYHERRESGDDEPLLLHRLLTAFVNLCQAVAHAHAKSIIHRDLKPENVALDSFGQVVLLDWGLAKINDETGADEAAFASTGQCHDASTTVASQVLGSPMYMAPEQAAGRLDEMDERTDVFGLGGILYAILTGVAPHEHTSPNSETRRGVSDLLNDIVSRPLLRPSSIVPDIPPALEAISLKATHQKRYLRYGGAADIAEDVERYLAGDQVSAYREPTSKRVLRWVQTHPRTSQALGIALVLLIALLTFGGYAMRQKQIAQNTLRFYRASDIAKEVAFQLESQAELATTEVRFVSELPPIQGIVDAGQPGTTETEAIWIERLETILEGLMRHNPAY
ncbi:MAG: serine/threonine-protein kinase, partial [Planctomycetota bacterium]